MARCLALLPVLAALAGGLAAVRAQEHGSSSNLPPDIQLLNEETNPTLRIPVSHSSYNWSMIKLVRVRASYGWLEISRDTVQYKLVRQSRTTKDQDEGFEASPRDLEKLRYEYGSVAFEAARKRHFLVFVSEKDWDRYDVPFMKRDWQPDPSDTKFILAALHDFGGTVARFKEYKAKLQAASAPAPSPVSASPPAQLQAAPPAPPTIVLVEPSVSSSGQTIEVTAPSLTIRGVAMDVSSLPIVAINGTPATMRPKSTQAVEFWSDALPLKPGENQFEITATDAAHAEAKFSFTARLAQPAAPASNPKGLSKADILDLLKNYVPSARVTELVKQNGVKFAPSADDLNEIRQASGGDDLIDAIRQAGTGPK